LIFTVMRMGDLLTLHPDQGTVFNSRSRFKVVTAGRRWGKTALARAVIIKMAGVSKRKIWYVAPTYQMAKQIMWDDLLDAIPKQWVKKVNETRMTIRLKNKTIVECKGADNPDCYDDQTEVLTDRGWKFFRDLDRTEKVLTLNAETNRAEYKQPIEYIDQHWDGPMFRISSNKLDLLVTPDHQFQIESRKGIRKFKQLDDIAFNDKIPASADWDGVDCPEITHDHCALMGMYLSEGCAYGNMGGDISKRKGNYEVTFAQSVGAKGGNKGDVREKFKKILENLGLNYRESNIGLHVLNKALWEELGNVGNVYSKQIPEKYKNLPKEKLKTLIDWMIMGDGTSRIRKPGHSAERAYYSVSKPLIDDFQEIAIKAGFSATYRVKHKKGSSFNIDGRDVKATADLYSISLHTTKFNYFRNSKGSYISTEQGYSGKVYSCRVENSTLMVRRNGKVCWSGNTLRGVGLHYVVLDEFQDMKPDVWTTVIRPTLASTGGHAMFIGTPKSFNHLYELHTLGQQEDYIKAKQWESWQFPTISSPFIPKSEIEQARKDMDEKSFRQEFEASFETMAGRVYYPFNRRTHVGEYEFNPSLPIWVGQDFNIDPMSSVIFQPQPSGELWAIDEIVLHGSNTTEVCDELERRYWRYMDNVTIYPDPAGGHRQHARGESDLDIFRERGFTRLKYRKKHPPIADRVNAVNRMLMSADGKIHLKVDRRCRNFIESLEQTIYKPGSRDLDKAANIEHSGDAGGYCIQYEYPMRKLDLRGISI